MITTSGPPYCEKCEQLKAEKAELLEALESIKKHQGLIGGNLAVMSATWTIANNAIKKAKGSDE